ncbi:MULTISPECIES: demethoxyubiquinone hydroxylase family protein [unclassified Massilia]|uniref:demethoxyubiquinone hydroxylase family protein n=1 Tax=unclassified Massilia TaxID=2609279 RepID=UPI0017802840|nr:MULTISPECIES: demethoxyubiquinone hydroxylase family protein [unclassified Massilia]MBD8532495.1 demethoxyubiquinone hydroxylase family protein [Massilia sp. CFBP 13647]MBD8675865.1 demethoxyubiquinone hydroxylase family protein [Massilia sp. CFBP 13721]
MISTYLNSGAGDRILKVNHAGEHGAVNIYAGQLLLARLRAGTMLAELAEFKAHEERHRSIFAGELERRVLRRCRSCWLCGTGGFLLGLFTGVLGPQAMATTTVAVERVVLQHLQQQLHDLGQADPEASRAISAIVRDEQEHHDRSAARAGSGGFLNRLLAAIVSGATEVVIWLGMRL